KWEKYQTINRPSPSKLPDPNTIQDKDLTPKESVNTHGILSEASLPKERKGKEVNLKEEKGKDLPSFINFPLENLDRVKSLFKKYT
ncbi:hypothetical protein, partial [Salmonella enterica]|uniref:hypothetical protein n=1 Tax=Salmonella enterica TaxID=28901 RepID=UPI003296CEFE